MEFSRQEYWSGYPFSSPGDLSNPGLDPKALTLQADSLPSEPPGGLQKSQTELSTCTTARCNVHNLSQLDVNANDFLILDLK